MGRIGVPGKFRHYKHSFSKREKKFFPAVKTKINFSLNDVLYFWRPLIFFNIVAAMMILAFIFLFHSIISHYLGLYFHLLPQLSNRFMNYCNLNLFQCFILSILNLIPTHLQLLLSDCSDISYLQFDGDDHRGEVFVQLLQHDQLLQGQVEQPVDKHKDGTFNSQTT